MREDWDELIKQQERSGMKPGAFCRAHGIDSQKFGYQRWRRKGAQKKEQFVRVDSGAVTFVEIVVRDGVTVRAPLSAIKEVDSAPSVLLILELVRSRAERGATKGPREAKRGGARGG